MTTKTVTGYGEGGQPPSKEGNMGRWIYDWKVTYYGAGQFIKNMRVQAKTREDALKKFHEQEKKCYEVISCIRTDKY